MKRRVGAAVALVAVLAATACSSADSQNEDAAAAREPLRVATMQPASLFPPDSSGAYAFEVLDNLYDGLIRFDQKTGEPVMMVAESIKTEDNVVFDIRLRTGWTFSSGEAITAKTFQKSWSEAATVKNEWRNSAKFAQITGYAELNAAGGAGEFLSGVQVVDDQTLKVTLTAPDNQFIYALGTAPFYPLPASAYDDVEAYTKQPVGNGPYKMAKAWDGEAEIELVRDEAYKGPKPAANPGIHFTIVTEEATPWVQLQADELDIALVAAADQPNAKKQLSDRFVRKAQSNDLVYLMVPTHLAGWNDPRVRQALSMAIDREAIIKAFFDESTVPLTDFSVPASVGYRQKTDLPYLKYDPAAAKALWEQVKADVGGEVAPISLGVPANYGWDEWGLAVLNGWRDVLGIEVAKLEPLANVSTAYEGGFADPVTRSRYSDTPSPATILVQQFTKGGTANWTDWHNPEFETTIQKALQQRDQQAAVAAFDEAKDILIEQMPIIMLWSQGDAFGLSDRVVDFPVDNFNKSNYRDVKVVDLN
ncbi:peptide/nickel transport system substrate-binding protein [Micromonospora pallida]|uniref:Peptide/nickel transport system substrate-binding protein n=1 Tax=Micromonospora pallida TaxID=145854 RepID=A0A1C6SF94_9ACTN|nr:ABC transporter substrate-binding protein [Micromonospora pallida]SCL28180.1 peptide/nickel transport system substrate-binding protein [Micromonospora pallida]